jgi:hypothetical protein
MPCAVSTGRIRRHVSLRTARDSVIVSVALAVCRSSPGNGIRPQQRGYSGQSANSRIKRIRRRAGEIPASYITRCKAATPRQTVAWHVAPHGTPPHRERRTHSEALSAARSSGPPLDAGLDDSEIIRPTPESPGCRVESGLQFCPPANVAATSLQPARSAFAIRRSMHPRL